MKAFVVTVMIFMLSASSALACAVCFGDPNSKLTEGVGNGVWVLMGFIGVVLLLFSVLFFNIYRRMKKISMAR